MKIFMIASFLLVVSLVMQASKAAETSGVSHKKICAAGIAATMGKPASIMVSGSNIVVREEYPDGSAGKN